MSASLPLDAFRDSYRQLIGFVARRTGCRQTAQELVHDAWLRVAERERQADRDTATAAPRAYLYAVAEHLAIDHLRRARRTAERFDPAGTEAGGHEGATPDVATAHTYREALAAVDAALAALPERRRAIFLADRLDGLPQADIAARHGVSVKTVEREVMHALDAVEAALRGWRGEAADALPARAGRRRALSQLLLGAGGLSIGTLALYEAWRQWLPGWQTDLATATGGRLTQPLPDGGSIVLDARTRAEVRYYPARRHVRLLAGAAFFAVAHDASRPFVVDAPGARITVLGTRFEVAVGESGSLLVAVEQGRVRVERRGTGDAGGVQELHADEALQWPSGAPPRRVTVQGGVAGWREGWLDFRGVSLGAAVQRLARYDPRPLRVAPDAAALPVFGRVHIANAEDWLRLLPRSLPVTVREEGAQRALVISRR